MDEATEKESKKANVKVNHIMAKMKEKT